MWPLGCAEVGQQCCVQEEELHDLLSQLTKGNQQLNLPLGWLQWLQLQNQNNARPNLVLLYYYYMLMMRSLFKYILKHWDMLQRNRKAKQSSEM